MTLQVQKARLEKSGKFLSITFFHSATLIKGLRVHLSLNAFKTVLKCCFGVPMYEDE